MYTADKRETRNVLRRGRRRAKCLCTGDKCEAKVPIRGDLCTGDRHETKASVHRGKRRLSACAPGKRGLRCLCIADKRKTKVPIRRKLCAGDRHGNKAPIRRNLCTGADAG